MSVRRLETANKALVPLLLCILCSACIPQKDQLVKNRFVVSESASVFRILIYPETTYATDLEIDEQGLQPGLEVLRLTQPEYTITEYDLTKANWIERRFDLSVDMSEQLGDPAVRGQRRAFVLSYEDDYLIGGVVYPMYFAAASRTIPVLHISNVEADDSKFVHRREYYELWCVDPFWGGPHTAVSIVALNPVDESRIGAYLARVVNGHPVTANETVKR